MRKAICKIATLIIMILVPAISAGNVFGGETNANIWQETNSYTESQTNRMGTAYVPDMPRASEIMGLSVVNKDKENLGRVTDLVIDSEGRVNYLIISRGGVLGMGDQLCAIPWQATKPQVRDKMLSVDISKDLFEKAPKFANWAELRSSEYRDRVLSYYAKRGWGIDEKPTPAQQ